MRQASLHINNPGNLALFNPEYFTKAILAILSSPVHQAYGFNLGIQNVRTRVLLAIKAERSFIKSVLGVFKRGHILKVTDAIICFVTIFMVYISLIWKWGRKECRGNNPVPPNAHLFPVFTEGCAGVAMLFNRCFQYSPAKLNLDPVFIDDGSVKRSDSPKRGRLVNPLVVRDVFPYFFIFIHKRYFTPFLWINPFITVIHKVLSLYPNQVPPQDLDEKTGDKTIVTPRFERSLVPAGRAANPFTSLSVRKKGGKSMSNEEKLRAFKALLEDPELAQEYLSRAERGEKQADAQGIAFKSVKLENLSADELLDYALALKEAEMGVEPPSLNSMSPDQLINFALSMKAEDEMDDEDMEEEPEMKANPVPPALRKRVAAAEEEAEKAEDEEPEDDRFAAFQAKMDARFAKMEKMIASMTGEESATKKAKKVEIEIGEGDEEDETVLEEKAEEEEPEMDRFTALETKMGDYFGKIEKMMGQHMAYHERKKEVDESLGEISDAHSGRLQALEASFDQLVTELKETQEVIMELGNQPTAFFSGTRPSEAEDNIIEKEAQLEVRHKNGQVAAGANGLIDFITGGME